MQAHHDRDVFQATDRRAARDRYSQPLTPAGREGSTKPPRARTRRDSAPTAEKRHCKGSARRSWIRCFGTRKTGHSAHEPPISSQSVTDVPLAGLSFRINRGTPTECGRPTPPITPIFDRPARPFSTAVTTNALESNQYLGVKTWHALQPVHEHWVRPLPKNSRAFAHNAVSGGIS